MAAARRDCATANAPVSCGPSAQDNDHIPPYVLKQQVETARALHHVAQAVQELNRYILVLEFAWGAMHCGRSVPQTRYKLATNWPRRTTGRAASALDAISWTLQALTEAVAGVAASLARLADAGDSVLGHLSKHNYFITLHSLLAAGRRTLLLCTLLAILWWSPRLVSRACRPQAVWAWAGKWWRPAKPPIWRPWQLAAGVGMACKARAAGACLADAPAAPELQMPLRGPKRLHDTCADMPRLLLRCAGGLAGGAATLLAWLLHSPQGGLLAGQPASHPAAARPLQQLAAGALLPASSDAATVQLVVQAAVWEGAVGALAVWLCGARWAWWMVLWEAWVAACCLAAKLAAGAPSKGAAARSTSEGGGTGTCAVPGEFYPCVQYIDHQGSSPVAPGMQAAACSAGPARQHAWALMGCVVLCQVVLPLAAGVLPAWRPTAWRW